MERKKPNVCGCAGEQTKMKAWEFWFDMGVIGADLLCAKPADQPSGENLFFYTLCILLFQNDDTGEKPQEK